MGATSTELQHVHDCRQFSHHQSVRRTLLNIHTKLSPTTIAFGNLSRSNSPYGETIFFTKSLLRHLSWWYYTVIECIQEVIEAEILDPRHTNSMLTPDLSFALSGEVQEQSNSNTAHNRCPSLPESFQKYNSNHSPLCQA